MVYGLFTQTVIFSGGCNSRIQHCTKDRNNPIFCVVSDAAVASDTENHGLCKQTITQTAKIWPILAVRTTRVGISPIGRAAKVVPNFLLCV
jgi:hypothetical protein